MRSKIWSDTKWFGNRLVFSSSHIYQHIFTNSSVWSELYSNGSLAAWVEVFWLARDRIIVQHAALYILYYTQTQSLSHSLRAKLIVTAIMGQPCNGISTNAPDRFTAKPDLQIALVIISTFSSNRFLSSISLLPSAFYSFDDSYSISATIQKPITFYMYIHNQRSKYNSSCRANFDAITFYIAMSIQLQINWNYTCENRLVWRCSFSFWTRHINKYFTFIWCIEHTYLMNILSLGNPNLNIYIWNYFEQHSSIF